MANFYQSISFVFMPILQDFDKAVYYGKLSIKLKNNDYLYYSNNLVAVLLKNKKSRQKAGTPKYTSSLALDSTNFHNKLTHVFLLHPCTDWYDAKPSQADSRGFVFIMSIKKIFHYRWHLFFTAWVAVPWFFSENSIISSNYSDPILD